MGQSHDTHVEFVEKFTIKPPLRKLLMALIGAGALMLVLGIVINIAMGEPEAVGHRHDPGRGPVNHPQVRSTATQNEGHTGHNGATHEAAAGHHSDEGHHAADDAGHGGGHGQHGSGAPFWLTRVLLALNQNAFFFMGIGIIMIFFIAVKFTANAGWHILMKRIPEAFSQFAPIGLLILVLMTFAQLAGLFHIHPWTDAGRAEVDALLQAKLWYQNVPFYLVRTVFVAITFIGGIIMFRRLSVAQDALGTTKVFWDQRKLSGAFLVLFAFTFLTTAFDYVMAIDPHWFSTMFGVHMFASCWVSALALMAILMHYMKTNGFLPQLNEAHFHDIGKMVFGFSIFWAYIWFCQFLLIWYANIPEETFYFKRILDDYGFLFALNLVINFVFPFLALMTNTSKRDSGYLAVVSGGIVFGHFIDLFLVHSPAGLGPHGSIGFIELGMFLLFLGIFLLLGFVNLTKRKLVNTGHPYLKESLNHWY